MRFEQRDRETLEAAELGTWFHNLHLPSGAQTAPAHPLGDFPAQKWRKAQTCLPEDMRGWSVLDIGCNAGFYSFALAARGADVLGIDVDPHYLGQAQWAAQAFTLERPPHFRQMSVYSIAELGRTFDLVWFMGVAYHLRHPLLALDLARLVARKHLMFQTMTFPDAPALDPPADFGLDERELIAAPGWPKLGFVEHRLAADPTNWWVANDAGARAMLRSSGFEVLETPEHESYWCRAAPTNDYVLAELCAVIRAAERP